ncbi:uncharacterized protein RHO25_007297 [Cercospora beticola]|uniref:Glycosyl hydrolase family 95 catalytic domain-containing protein n=1 Tax=Cercospora beticola TaxID=122368 RepID=A0ABZ0NT52_CERBT|nr:hypothetical protein RHO25_007297 [Cercospora beticola]
MADAITFYNQFAVEKDGRWDIYPSLSPENAHYIPEGQKTAGTWTGLDRTTEMDKAILWDLYRSFIELSNANNQQIVGAIITAGVDGPIKIRVQDGRVFRVNGEVYSGPIMATSGQTYTVSF